VVAFALSIPVVLADDNPTRNWQYIPVFIALIGLGAVALLRVVIRRQGIVTSSAEIPLLLGLYYLSPLELILVRVAAGLAVQWFRRTGTHRMWFNVAGFGAGAACANVVVYTFGLGHITEVRTWLVLGGAVLAYVVVISSSVHGVILLVQGAVHLRQVLKSIAFGIVVASINIVLGLIMLLTLSASPWGVVLLACFAVAVGAVYRAYSQFLRQHESLTEMHALSRAIGAATYDGTLPDALLTRTRALLQTESATLWLPSHGRYPELLLSARADYTGLLDSAPTPYSLRRTALDTGESVFVGHKGSDPLLLDELRKSDIKDAIVTPLHSGNATIGTLEVAGRLGKDGALTTDDVRLLETLAAHTSVAVENSRLVDRLQFDAYHDTMTGLPNRRRVLEALDETVSARAPGEVVAVMMFDVLALREVNDSLGYAAGDKVLTEVARRLVEHAPPVALVARVGGDEFAVEMRAESADAALAIAEELRARVRDRMVIDSLTVDVDTSVGLAIYPDHGEDPETLLQRAEVATYAARSRSSAQLFNPGLESRSVRRLGLASDLRKALDDGELEVYFQPKVALRDRRLVGVECLARWDHPVHGTVSPQDFVAVAEHTGQLARLTERVLREGLGRAREWADAGRSLSVAVNLCPRTLVEPDLSDQIAALLAEYGVSPDRLTLEIAEDAMIGGERPLPALQNLRELGVRLSVDDFGTGQSSLALLRLLPVQEIKIDRSFVQGMATDTGDLAIVRTIVDMSRHFGLAVVAEGVESELTLGLLEEMGCDIGQGFLFSRPLPYERLDAWLEAQTDGDPARAAGEVRWLRAVP
jgi:diguanylate cyclase (GGDEF)-like protein